MTAGIGAALPLQPAPPAVDGEVADPAASLPFLAALAAAVAAPVTPPPAPVVEATVTLADALAADDGESAAGETVTGTTEESLVALARAEGHAVRTGSQSPEGHEATDRAAATETGDDTTTTAEAESTGGRLRVMIAERAAPRAAEAPARPLPAASPEAATPPASDPAERDDDREPRGKALGATNRAEPATPATRELPQGAIPATPSWHAAMQALAATSRTAAPEPTPAPEAPLALPMPATTGAAGERGRPSGAASSTAAGVLAVMHAAHLAQRDGEPTSAPVARFADQVVATLTPGRDVAEASTTEGDAVAPQGVAAVAETGEPAPLPTPLRVVVTARADSSHGRQDTAHDHRDEAPGQERRTLTPAATGTTEAPVNTGRAPWMTAEAATMPSAADVAKPALEVHRAAEPRPTPPSPTSQVTVELDAEQTGAQRVRVAVRGDVVHATVVTDRGGVEAMRPQLDDLRHALEGQGFREAHVQLRVAADGSPAVSSGGAAELRLRSDAPSRAPDGSGAEQQPRGRQRGQDHQPPPGGQPDFEEELL